MSNLEAQYRVPQNSEGSHVPHLLRLAFSPWITVMAMAGQMIISGFGWVLVGVMNAGIIPFPDDLANLIQNHHSATVMVVTVISTVLGIIGSSLLGVTVQHALTFRLPRKVALAIVTPWVHLARGSLFLRPWRHPWWTLLSLLWVAVIRFLTTAWTTLLLPVLLFRQIPVNGQELNLLSSAVSNLIVNEVGPYLVDPTTRSYSLTPGNAEYFGNQKGYFSQAGRAAATVFINSTYPAFIGQFNSSTGGINPATPAQSQLSDFHDLPLNHRGLSTSYTLWQQGYTADISCRMLSSPSITLNNITSVDHTSETPSGAFNYTLETWSWTTNCSGNGQYYTGEVDILTANNGSIGNALFATSVCFYQDFSGPSNQSFLVLMQLPNNSVYSALYSMQTVCQVTPMVTIVEAQYNETGLVNVNKVLVRAPLPDYSWPVASIQGINIWGLSFLAQGPYSNSFADDPFEALGLLNSSFPSPSDIAPVLEQYLRGIFEFEGSVLRGSLTPTGYSLPHNMSIPLNGTMHVQTIGWEIQPQTHGAALAVITLVTMMTAVSAIYALSEANYRETANTLRRGNTRGFNPTNLMDVLVGSSMGSLANALSRPQAEQYREQLMVGLAVTDEGQSVLNARTDGASDAGKAELG